MPEIPDLSKLKNGSKPEPETPEEQPVNRTAFLVLVDANGNIQVSSEVGENTLVDHMASHDEIWSACQLIIKDIQVQQTAGLVSNSLLQMGSALQQHAQEQALRARLNLK